MLIDSEVLKELTDTGLCGDRLKDGHTVFTCREKGYHLIHDDHRQTDGTHMRWT